ncbi:MAG TPA: hypothetical protein PL110_19230 [Candidatus Eremiobacteraeota bacterium]|nr:hypothetical protein [Candidatus Eremiobacteraeota bacterium]
MNESNKNLIMLNYIFPFWVSIYTLFFSDKKEDPACKFHGWQSLALGLLVILTSWVCGLGILVWGYRLFYAWKIHSLGQEMTIPMLTDFAQKQANK